ncbi:hypothetical protein FKP32DRAFT_35187 [Trametes sanguinea]|nr:hypothetical protein FKP32DRAFT_35187 [Trametes sanguinea]
MPSQLHPNIVYSIPLGDRELFPFGGLWSLGVPIVHFAALRSMQYDGVGVIDRVLGIPDFTAAINSTYWSM